MRPTDPRNSTAANLTSAFIAGVVAFAIYFFITVLIEGFSPGLLLPSLLVGISTSLVAWLVTTLIVASVRRRKGS